MKVIQFTIPVVRDNAILVEVEVLPHFYNHLHRHNEVQITWVMEGTGTLIVGNYMKPFKAGEVYIIGANQPHILKNDKTYFKKTSKQKVRAITIFFNPEVLMRTVLQLPETKAIKKFLEKAMNGLQVPAGKVHVITGEIAYLNSVKEGYKLATFLRLMQMLAEIKNLSPLATASLTTTFTDIEGLRMNNIYQYTMANYAEPIKLKQVADIAFLSPQAFCRYFKKHTRKTYFDFLNEVRVNEACKKMITNGDASIVELAQKSGFKSASNFCRVFKKITKISPLQYAKNYQEGVLGK
jgi:AraC-like DNA-binding protein